MVVQRLISLAAGVTTELAADPSAFVRSAADAGWPAAGVWFDPESWTSRTTSDVAAAFADTGLVALDMEVVRIGAEADHGDQIVDAAAEIGARNILAISSLDDADATAERLGQLCRRAAPAGIKVCIEFMRFTQVKTLADALDIAERTGEPNVGILVDLLHVHRSASDLSALSTADPALFPYAQWCDAPAEPRGWSTGEIIQDALHDRCPPGEGGLDATSFPGLFAPDVPMSLEVRSAALADDFPDPTDRARSLLERTRAAMEPSAS